MRLPRYEWHPRPPTKRERIFAGLLLALLLVAAGSYYGGLRLFGDYDRQVNAAVVLLGFVWFVRFAPTVRRL